MRIEKRSDYTALVVREARRYFYFSEGELRDRAFRYPPSRLVAPRREGQLAAKLTKPGLENRPCACRLLRFRLA